MSRDKSKRAQASLSGTVEVKHLSRGSKSERDAVVLSCGDGEVYVLRMRGGHPFKDPALDALVGKTLTLTGTLIEKLFLIDRWEESAPQPTRRK